uniref:Putative cofilin/tropomyosin family drebrinlike protein abp1 n=1 Tax=Anopheles marajoara TaxID=58244 RepID=A0A2M4BI89_9DIPT
MCDILAAISYGYGGHHHYERPRKRVKINMTIPSRPAPPPPQQQQQRSTTVPSRYTPTTDWDFCAFGTATGAAQQQQQQQHGMKQKKPPPPRPPPPKVQSSQLAPIVPALKKPGQPQSINILSSLFGQKRSASGSSANGKTNASVVQKSNSSSSSVPIKLLPPPAPLAPPPSSGSSRSGGSSSYGSFAPSSGTGTAPSSGEMQLITFDSPPSSPTFTQKSCSDCISVDSFSSDSNYSSPNGGNMSQAESGFEDDFVASASGFNQQRSGSAGMTWGDLIDPFESNGSSRAVNYAPLPLTTAQVRAPLVNSKLQQSDFIDPLCNGRTVTSKIPTVSMPTIIKPPTVGSGSQKSTPQHAASALQTSARANLAGGGGVFAASKRPAAAAPPAVADYFSTEVDSFDSLPSLPMPTIPPPPPPPVSSSSSSSAGVVDTAEEPYGIALYNFEGETDEDLTLKVNEKIYLLRRITDEWYMGRDRRGLVGMFPVNYVEVKVPLSSDEPAQLTPSATFSASAATQQRSDAIKVRALYHFSAETPEDLTLREDDLVTVLYQITPEWLYGEVNGRRGQFPANFIEYVPPNLPTKTTNGGV